MTAMVFDLSRARIAQSNGQRSLLYPWTPESGSIEIDDFRIGDRVRFRDGKVGTIVCFGASGTRDPLVALVTVNGMKYMCPIAELRSAG